MRQSRLVIGLGQSLSDVEKLYIIAVLAACNNSRREASESLGISIESLNDKMERWRKLDEVDKRGTWSVK